MPRLRATWVWTSILSVSGARAADDARITAEQVCHIVALACEAPSGASRPISQWTSRELAEEICARGIVEQISPRHAARLLKKTICSRT